MLYLTYFGCVVGWKVTLKYFQNVVDTVRDLMSPNADEQHYKNGMRFGEPQPFVLHPTASVTLGSLCL
jgi:hypothetical protein